MDGDDGHGEVDGDGNGNKTGNGNWDGDGDEDGDGEGDGDGNRNGYGNELLTFLYFLCLKPFTYPGNATATYTVRCYQKSTLER